MNGIVFNLLEGCIQRRFGDDAWDELLEAAGLEGAYTPLGAYPDAQLYALVRAASGVFDRPPAEFVRWFGREAVTLLHEKYPEFFRPHDDALSFLVTLNTVIHPEVQRIFPGAATPNLSFRRRGATGAVMEYQSERQLCAFAEGLIEGSAPIFGERVLIERPSCRLRGDAACVFYLSFVREGG